MADGATWRLTVDYCQLNKHTLTLAPVVAKYPEVLASVVHGARWFSIIDLVNVFFAVPVHQECW